MERARKAENNFRLAAAAARLDQLDAAANSKIAQMTSFSVTLMMLLMLLMLLRTKKQVQSMSWRWGAQHPQCSLRCQHPAAAAAAHDGQNRNLRHMTCDTPMTRSVMLLLLLTQIAVLGAAVRGLTQEKGRDRTRGRAG